MNGHHHWSITFAIPIAFSRWLRWHEQAHQPTTSLSRCVNLHPTHQPIHPRMHSCLGRRPADRSAARGVAQSAEHSCTLLQSATGSASAKHDVGSIQKNPSAQAKPAKHTELELATGHSYAKLLLYRSLPVQLLNSYLHCEQRGTSPSALFLCQTLSPDLMQLQSSKASGLVGRCCITDLVWWGGGAGSLQKQEMQTLGVFSFS